MTDEQRERATDDLEPFYDRVAEVIHGTASAAQMAQLEAELRADPRARAAYLHYTLLHAQLSLTDAALMAQAQAAVPEPTDSHARPFTLVEGLARRAGRTVRDRPWMFGTAAACLIALLVGGLAALRRPGIMPPHGAVASLVEARDLVWAQGQAPIVASARLEPQEIRWLGGTLTLAFDSGALVTLVGPADVQLLSDMRLRAARGRITTRVQGRARGFAIETPSTVVVDRGTEFGLEVDTAGQTGVVVFKGLVDLALPGPAQGPAAIKRLSQGEGMRIGRTGHMSRIVAVERGSDLDEWSIGPSTNQDQDVVIRSIRDNLRDLGSSKYYEVVHGGLADGAASYVDRLFQWRGLGPGGLPDFLRGADYIMTFNDDKRTADLQITVELGPAATLYIFYDDRQATPPWLVQQFTDTGVNIGLDVTADPGWDPKTPPYPYSVWKRDLEPGASISLGANEIGAARSMYGIAAAHRP
jgi:hypothetical protein